MASPSSTELNSTDSSTKAANTTVPTELCFRDLLPQIAPMSMALLHELYRNSTLNESVQDTLSYSDATEDPTLAYPERAPKILYLFDNQQSTQYFQQVLNAHISTIEQAYSEQVASSKHDEHTLHPFNHHISSLVSSAVSSMDEMLLNKKTPEADPRYALACIWIPNATSQQLQQYLPIITRCRDIHAEHTIVFTNPSLQLYAYGFNRLQISSLSDLNNSNSLESDTMRVLQALVAWQFNLYDYKPRPDWFNADYWANPENWGKFFW